MKRRKRATLERREGQSTRALGCAGPLPDLTELDQAVASPGNYYNQLGSTPLRAEGEDPSDRLGVDTDHCTEGFDGAGWVSDCRGELRHPLRRERAPLDFSHGSMRYHVEDTEFDMDHPSGRRDRG